MPSLTAPLFWRPTTKKLRGFVLDRDSGKPVPGIVVDVQLEPDQGVVANLGLLVTDVAGYVAFDLSAYLARFDSNPQNIRIEALGYAAELKYVSGSLDGIRFGYDFLLFLNNPTGRRETRSRINLPSVQSPGLTDWEISPHSFVVKPEDALGAGACATPHPHSLPERTFRFARVLTLYEAQDKQGDDRVSALDISKPLSDFDSADGVKTGYVLEFSQSWHLLGHSIGDLVYSLPLAPCESVNVAVIEWQRQDNIRRGDQVRSEEDLLHDQRRDRMIDETITGALQENQSGWSVMGGHAHADSGSASADLTKIVGFPLSVAGAASNLFALGGGIASSSGTRNLTAGSLQDLHDRIYQSTSMVRSLSSTVIIQGTQRELNFVQTRTVTNHNHCHAMTVQYFEVLRHFKMITRYERRRRVVLVPYKVITFTRTVALRYRQILEAVLLRLELKVYFDALERLQVGSDIYLPATGSANLPETSGTAEPTVDYFSGQQSFEVAADEVHQTGLLIEPGSLLQVSAKGDGIKFSFDLGTGYGPAGENRIAQAPFPAPNKHEYALLAQVGGHFFEVGAGASFVAQHGGSLRFQFNDHHLEDNQGSATVEVAVTRPSQQPRPTPQGGQPKPQTPTEKTDKVLETLLVNHLNENVGYYNQAIWLLQNATERRIMLEMQLLNRPDLLNGLDDTPIAIRGNYLAFALNTGEDLERLRPENDREYSPRVDITSLPTRGVFAEAMLGHCNACEVRDVTRFWKWQESPCETAPAISSIAPGPHGQTPNVTASSVPAAVVQIAPVAPAPDPVGLAAALNLLGRPDLFRNMSGLAEVSGMLNTLASGAVTSMKDVQDLARDAKAKVDSAQAAVASGATSARNQSPEERFDNLQVAQQAAGRADNLGFPEEAQQRAFETVLGTLQDMPSTAGLEVAPQGVEDAYYFQDLITYQPPQPVLTDLGKRGLKWQRISDGYGDVNLDMYMLEITKLPNDPASGAAFTEDSLFEHVRKNFPALLIRYGGMPGPSLVEYEAADKTKWHSNDPTGAVMKFRIDGRPFAHRLPSNPLLAGLPIPEFGLVVCSEYVSDSANGDWHWRFVTVEGTGVIGYHPVSGTRQFGLRRTDQSLVFVIRAADRVSTAMDYPASALVFSGAEAYWEGFFQNLLTFVNTNGGTAAPGPIYSQRHKWGLVQTLLFGKTA